MAQELKLLQAINDHKEVISAAELAHKVGSDELLIGRVVVYFCESRMHFSWDMQTRHN